ncbi:PaaI family thioesterase [Dyella sp. C9]|uniref:PaaI family thioesterase n=1 Tax=Dyella sp. C9 TaxID=2202154 RepID=UPI0018E505D0|nr:PaaI family thioesterase [Dyella sp. C9]
MDDLEAFARRIFQSQPFSRHLGAELSGCGADHAEITLRIADHHKQQHGFVHGGVISYLADNAITFAGGLALGGDALTSEFKINYLRPGVGSHLIARAHARGKGKRQAVCLCEVIAVADDGTETLCALAQGTVVSATP